ncbi:MAG: glycoside hydrolase family 97 protein [Caldithrix sp.]|nr:glycoside hydrolase family 97 protein [Caldithrix sp.]
MTACTGYEYDAQHTVHSPDGNVKVQFMVDNGWAYYKVHYGSVAIIDASRLGFELKNQPDLLDSLQVISTEERNVDHTWQTVWGTQNSIRNHYRELTVHLQEQSKPHRNMDIIFRIFNDGVGFRYSLPQQDYLQDIQITSEITEFDFNGNHLCWWIPNDYDSYERLYRTTPLREVPAANTPFTLRLENDMVVSIHEADLTDYPGMTLKKAEQEPLKMVCDLVPWPDGIKVKGQTPLQTPWRTIQIGKQDGDLIASNLILNLNRPNQLEDVSWIKPMKYIGIWWGMHINKYTWHAGPNHGATTERSKRYIDFAARHDIPAVLVEGWNKGWESWLSGKNVQNYTESYPDFDLQEVVRYGKTKGVVLIGHHETGGNVPHYEKQMKSSFELYHDLGVPAVKTGYAGQMTPEGMHHHGQWMVTHYREVVKLAAKNKITINAHEPIKPTGIRRTYPNMITREGARGMEYNAWSPGNPPEHTVILPFTRLLGGPMDYTPGIFKFDFDQEGLNRVWTTLAKQLAYYIVLYSPLQMAADLPENYENQPAFQFIQEVPVDWDESVVLKARIGDYLSIARRQGNQWYVGSITDEQRRLFNIPLDFLDQNTVYKATIYADDADTDWHQNPTALDISSYRVDHRDHLLAALSPSGGQAVAFTPVSEEEADPLLPIDSFNDQSRKKMDAFKKVRVYGEPVKVENDAIGAAIELKTAYGQKYNGGGERALINGAQAPIRRPERHWQGFLGQDLHAVIDLGDIKPVQSISMRFLQDYYDSIFFPEEITFSVSKQGRQFVVVARFENEISEQGPQVDIREIHKALDSVSARYIQVMATNIQKCPSWHKNAGQKAWLLSDEIMITTRP